MARLQILELPAGADDDRPPFALVVDQHVPLRYVSGIDMEERTVDEFAGVAEQIGARGVLVFREPVEIPANGPLPPFETDDAERAGTTQLVYAHERTRLDLCNALLLSGDTTWRKLIEQVGERQREVAHLYRARDSVRDLPERPDTRAVNPEHPLAYMDGYAAGIRAAKQAAGGGG